MATVLSPTELTTDVEAQIQAVVDSTVTALNQYLKDHYISGATDYPIPASYFGNNSSIQDRVIQMAQDAGWFVLIQPYNPIGTTIYTLTTVDPG